jgi:hypothetical protein
VGIEITDGKMRVSYGYGLKVNLDPDGYDMHDAHMSVSFEFDVEGDTSALLQQAEMVEADLAAHAKLGVFAELGVEFDETSEGVLIPRATKKKAKPKKRTRSRSGGGSSQSRSRSGGRSRQQSKPKADLSNEPTYEVDFGKGVAEYIDLRDVKARGDFKEGAADFRNVDNPREQYWLYSKDGDENDDVFDALEEAGVPV